MSKSSPRKPAKFDRYARQYDAELDRGISVSGEDKNYFARGRLAFTARLLAAEGVQPNRVMDFGCGTGSATPFFFEQMSHVTQVVGTDVSAASLEIARREHAC